MTIDAHMHLIQRKNFDPEIYKKLDMLLPNDTDLDTLVGWLRKAGITRAVAMGQDQTRIWNTVFGDDHVKEAYRRYPDFFIPFVSLEPMDKANRFNQEAYDKFEKEVGEGWVRGVLITPPYGQFMSNDKTVYPFYQLAQKKDIVVQYHHSAQMGPAVLAPTKYANMFNLNDVIVDFPKTKFVVEHLGYPWTEHLFILMTNCKTMYTDLAMTYKRPLWVAWQLVLAREYGVLDRVMYASDYVSYSYDLFSEDPSRDFAEWIEVVKTGLNEINEKSGWPLLTDKEIQGILVDNAARLYGL